MNRPLKFLLLYLGLILFQAGVQLISGPILGFDLFALFQAVGAYVQGVEALPQFHELQSELGANALWLGLFGYLTLIGLLAFGIAELADRLWGVRHIDLQA